VILEGAVTLQTLHWLQRGVTYIRAEVTPSRVLIPKPNYLPHPWTHPTYHPKMHPYLISCFATMHRTDEQTDQQMVGGNVR